MLFGLQVSARKRYSKLVDIPFEVSNITLSASTTSTARATLVVRDGKDEFAICSLTLGKIENFSTSLHFPLGSEISFTLEAPEDYDGVFHLTGQYIDEAEESDSECCDFDSEGEEFDLEGGEFDSEEEGFDSEDDSEEEVVEEIIDQEPSDIEMEDLKEAALKAPEPKRMKEQAPQKKESKPDQKKDNKPVNESKPAKDSKPANESKPDQSERTFPSGLKIKDLALGKGKKVTQGAKVSMQYVGKLTNGKIFDKSKPNSPLKFTMGAGQVIPGMEQGVLGMNYGGKRLITIPPELGYGRKRIGDIPANSTLVFEITILEREN